LQAEIERLRKENESLKHCGADDEEKRLQLVTQISTIKEDIALSLRKTSATNKNLKKENEELVKQLNDLQSVRKENTEMRALKRENDRLNSLIEVDKGTLANLKSKVKKMTEERQSTEEYNDKLKKENTKLKLRIKSLEMEIESLKIRKKLPNADNDTRSEFLQKQYIPQEQSECIPKTLQTIPSAEKDNLCYLIGPKKEIRQQPQSTKHSKCIHQKQITFTIPEESIPFCRQ